MKELFNFIMYAGLLCRALAAESHKFPTDTCTANHRVGQSEFCCDGQCIGGNDLCFNPDCRDARDPPPCKSHQIFTSLEWNSVDNARGACYLSSCNWQNHHYDWNCCDCPAGYVAVHNDCANQNDLCFGCTESNEVVTYNSNSEGYVCLGPDYVTKACEMEQRKETLLDGLSFGLTYLGGICPAGYKGLTNVIGLAATALGNIWSVANWYLHGSPQQDSTTYSLAGAVVSTITSVLLGLGYGGAVAALPELAVAFQIFDGLCFLDAIASDAISAAQAFDVPDPKCKAQKSPRDRFVLMRKSEAESYDEGTLEQRSSTSNNCTDLLNTFSGNASSLSGIYAGCLDLATFSAKDTLEPGVANATAVLQQACNNMTSQQNVSATFQLPDMLNAIQAFVPYCDNSTQSSTSLALSSVSSKTSSLASSSSSSSTTATVKTPSSSSVSSSSSGAVATKSSSLSSPSAPSSSAITTKTSILSSLSTSSSTITTRTSLPTSTLSLISSTSSPGFTKSSTTVISSSTRTSSSSSSTTRASSPSSSSAQDTKQSSTLPTSTLTTKSVTSSTTSSSSTSKMTSSSKLTTTSTSSSIKSPTTKR